MASQKTQDEHEKVHTKMEKDGSISPQEKQFFRNCRTSYLFSEVISSTFFVFAICHMRGNMRPTYKYLATGVGGPLMGATMWHFAWKRHCAENLIHNQASPLAVKARNYGRGIRPDVPLLKQWADRDFDADPLLFPAAALATVNKDRAGKARSQSDTQPSPAAAVTATSGAQSTDDADSQDQPTAHEPHELNPADALEDKHARRETDASHHRDAHGLNDRYHHANLPDSSVHHEPHSSGDSRYHHAQLSDDTHPDHAHHHETDDRYHHDRGGAVSKAAAADAQHHTAHAGDNDDKTAVHVRDSPTHGGAHAGAEDEVVDIESWGIEDKGKKWRGWSSYQRGGGSAPARGKARKNEFGEEVIDD